VKRREEGGEGWPKGAHHICIYLSHHPNAHREATETEEAKEEHASMPSNIYNLQYIVTARVCVYVWNGLFVRVWFAYSQVQNSGTVT
jgi:hypothetical protein